MADSIWIRMGSYKHDDELAEIIHLDWSEKAFKKVKLVRTGFIYPCD